MSSFIDLLVKKVATNLSDMRSVGKDESIQQEGADSPVDVKNQILANKVPDNRYVSIPNLEDPAPVNSDITKSPHPVSPGMMKVAPPYVPPPAPQPQPPQQPGMQPANGQPQPQPQQPQQPGMPPGPPQLQMPPVGGPQPPAPMPPGPPQQPGPPQPQMSPMKQATMLALGDSAFPVGLIPEEIRGIPRQDEPTLQKQYEMQRDKILNMAGQLDPATGKPIKVKDVDRVMTSLNAAAARALNNMRLAKYIYKEPAESKQASVIDMLVEKRGNNLFSAQPNPLATMPGAMSPFGYSQQGFNHANGLNPYLGTRYGITPGPFGAQQNWLYNQMPFSYNQPYGYNSVPNIPPYPSLPAFGGYTPFNPQYQNFGYGRDFETRPRLDSIRSEIEQLNQRKLNTQLETQGLQDPDLANQYRSALTNLRNMAKNISAHGEYFDPENKPLVFREGKANANHTGLWRFLTGRSMYTDEGYDNQRWAEFRRAQLDAEELKNRLRSRQSVADQTVGPQVNDRLTSLQRQQKAYEDEERRLFEQRNTMQNQVFNQMLNPHSAHQAPGMGSMGQPVHPSMNQPGTTAQSPQVPGNPHGLPQLPPGFGNQPPAPQAVPQPEPPKQPDPKALVTNRGTVEPGSLAQKSSSASELALRDMFHVKQAGPYTDALSTLAKLLGTGALSGGVYGALSSPSDYMLEGAGRGALIGAASGAGAGLGGGLGRFGGRGLSKGLDVLYGGKTSPLSGVLETGGMISGAAPAALFSGIQASRALGLPAWDAGNIPLTEQMELAIRRRNHAPDFKQPLVTGNRIPNSVDAPFGLNVLKTSTAKSAAQAAEDMKQESTVSPGMAGLRIAGAGAGVGAGLGAGIGAVKGVYNHYYPKDNPSPTHESVSPARPKTIRGHIGRGALAGAINLGIPASILGALVSANRMYNG